MSTHSNSLLHRSLAFARVITTFSALLCSLGIVLAREKHLFNEGWRFHLGEPSTDPSAKGFDDSDWETVSVPHSHRIFSADVREYSEHGREHGYYSKVITMPAEWQGKKVFLEFQGAMQTTKAWVNGALAGEYAVSGYDSFHFDLTPLLRVGENRLVVLVDNRPREDIPPDGTRADYLLFGGLYRDVFLHITNPVRLMFPWEEERAGIRITYPEISEKSATIEVEAGLRNETANPVEFDVVSQLLDAKGNPLGEKSAQGSLGANGRKAPKLRLPNLANPMLWSPPFPYLYTVRTTVKANGAVVDEHETRIGLRWAKFDQKKGFFLNGKHLKLIGVNRHQTWPYIGGAVPNNLHRFDAEQIKAIGANWVRLSHYPHDPDFLDALDELGLLAVAEGPTWDAVGKSIRWLPNLVSSFRSMVRRDRNHPSIVVWNASINHHGSDPALVNVAEREDPSRTIGQYNVLLPMDFRHRIVSGDGALSIEHTGHTFPAKRGSLTARKERTEFNLARRHWEHIDAVLGQKDNAGAATWAMFDYNTFHNTDERGTVWHGISDLFRIPKHSYWWHAAEFSDKPVLKIVRDTDSSAVVFSNCGELTGRFQDREGDWQEVHGTPESLPGAVPLDYLRHPPIRFKLPADAQTFMVTGKHSGGPVEQKWAKPGEPKRFVLRADGLTGAKNEIVRVLVSIEDEAGNLLPASFEARIAPKESQLVGSDVVNIVHGQGAFLARVYAGTSAIKFGFFSEPLSSDSVTLNLNSRK